MNNLLLLKLLYADFILYLLGGLSYFTGTEGFAADTVKNYEVVLGDGSIVNANAKENPDLWWALKGGGNNFGNYNPFNEISFIGDDNLIYGLSTQRNCNSFRYESHPKAWRSHLGRKLEFPP